MGRHKGKLSGDRCRELSEGYFERCREQEQHPSLPGLALALGLDSGGELYKLIASGGKAGRVVRRAVTRVEEANIQSVYRKDTAQSAKFILQNGFGYSEKPGSTEGEDIRVEIGP